MKKILALVLCVMLAFCFAGCAEEKGEMPDKAPVKSSTDNAAEENQQSEQTEKKNDETQGGAEAPVVESAEELEGMINEFNDTDDPERKEELRQQLEAILSQAEEMAQ